jgi:NAD(P)-dependent dehydrogenase (short-subunit alcohol dehydrogenase family)
MANVERPVALVTGAARGIGLEVCRQLAGRGLTVILGARDLERAEAAARPLVAAGLDVRPRVLDITREESLRGLAAELISATGRLDVLVNNAAAQVDWSETATSADLHAARAVFDTNLFGTWRACQVFLPLIRRSAHGRIVLVSSGAGSHGDPEFGLPTGRITSASYGISKAALNALAAKLAAELDGTGILVNAVCPGLTATEPGMAAKGARLPAESAASVVWAATLPDDGPTGGFFRDGKPLPW